MTTVVVLQPGYVPWLGFFEQMARADHFVYYDDVQFDKHGWRNRNRIKGPKGPEWLTVPVRHSGRADQLILETEIVTDAPWVKKQVRTLEQLYARAAYRDPFLGEFAALIERPWRLLCELDIAVVELMRAWFEIGTPIHRSSQIGIGGGQSERLVNICRHFGATRYVSGSAARAYLDVDLFAQAGIEVAWQDYRHPEYPQLHGAFVSHLSALDLALNVGRESREVILGKSKTDEGENHG